MTINTVEILKNLHKPSKSLLVFMVTLGFQQSLWAVTHSINDAEIREKLNANYSPAYTLSLEEAYGPGMTSEGGKQAIEKMFAGIPLKGKKMLDIGSGLGEGCLCILLKSIMLFSVVLR